MPECLYCRNEVPEGREVCPNCEKSYLCLECVNKNTPLCDNCSAIVYPSGRSSKPSQFVSKRIERGEVDERTLQLAEYIKGRVAKGAPIHISIVVEYNKRLDRK